MKVKSLIDVGFFLFSLDSTGRKDKKIANAETQVSCECRGSWIGLNLGLKLFRAELLEVLTRSRLGLEGRVGLGLHLFERNLCSFVHGWVYVVYWMTRC